MEASLGISESFPELHSALINTGTPSNVTQSLATAATLSSFLTSEICQVLQDAIPIILQIALDLNINVDFEHGGLWSLLSTKRQLVTRCGLNSGFVSTCRVDRDDFIVSWMSTGSTITLLILLMRLRDHKDTITIYITRKFELPFYSAY